MKTTNSNLNQKYNKGIIAIHWLSTLLILILFPLGKYMSSLEATEKIALIQTHTLIGLTVFILTLMRTWMFFYKKRPKDIKTGSNFNDKLIICIHNLFYILLFVIAISGITTMINGGYIEALESHNAEFIQSEENIKAIKIHGLSSLIIMVLLLVHITGVIKHYIKTKENTLKRIIP